MSVLTPVLNEASDLDAAVTSMRRQVFDGHIEFIFIDGGSEDGSAERLLEQTLLDDRVLVLRNPARRTPNALNLGLDAARGSYIARMDAHCVYPSDYLQLGVDRLRAGGVAWASGPQIPEGRGGWSERVALALRSRLGTGGAGFRHVPKGEIEVDSGFCGIWRKETLVEQGGWDEGWPVNQDGELAARIRQSGGRIVSMPEMAASYIPRNSLRALRQQYWRYGQYKAKTAHRHPIALRRSHLLPSGLVLVAVCGALRAGWPRRSARSLLVVYGAVLLSEAIRIGIGRDRPGRDAVSLPLVWAIMHVAWGAGFLWGSARFGPPVDGVARTLRPRRPHLATGRRHARPIASSAEAVRRQRG